MLSASPVKWQLGDVGSGDRPRRAVNADDSRAVAHLLKVRSTPTYVVSAWVLIVLYNRLAHQFSAYGRAMFAQREGSAPRSRSGLSACAHA